MRILYLILLFSLSLLANPYQSSILSLHGKVFPKLILLDSNIEKKLVDGALKLSIVYSEKDLNVAKDLKKKILAQSYSIKNYQLDVEIVEYKKLHNNYKTTAIYQLLGEKEDVISVNRYALENSILTFSYDNSYLELGTVMTLHIGKKVTPHINLGALKEYKIALENRIYAIAKIDQHYATVWKNSNN